MSEDMKKFLIGLCCLPIVLIVLTYFAGEYYRERETARATAREKAAALWAAKSPEQQLREKINGITEYTYGYTTAGEPALQLTIRQPVLGLFSTPQPEFNRAAARHIRYAYETHPALQTLDIDYHSKFVNVYGETSYRLALRIQFDRDYYDKIVWSNFDPQNIPRLSTFYHPFARDFDTR